MRMFALVLAVMVFQASNKPVLLSPNAFPDLPAAFRADLIKRGCQVPQSYWPATQHNVISGSFAKRGQTDWVVLCSVSGSSAPMVYWGGSARCSAPVGPSPDFNFVQGIEPGKMAFSRYISTAEPARINKRARDYGRKLPFAIDHDGIDDAFVGKGSTVLYCHQGQWHELQGAD